MCRRANRIISSIPRRHLRFSVVACRFRRSCTMSEKSAMMPSTCVSKKGPTTPFFLADDRACPPFLFTSVAK